MENKISFFQKNLTIWVLLCMIVGILIGHFIPIVPNILKNFEIAGISIVIAVLIWVMIYPMMIKVDFNSIKEIGKNPKGLIVTWITNWIIKPFTMYFITSLFLFIIFKSFIGRDVATEYLENVFVKKFDGITTIGLLLTLIIIFATQSEVIISNPLHIVLIAVPLIIQTFLIFFIA